MAFSTVRCETSLKSLPGRPGVGDAFTAKRFRRGSQQHETICCGEAHDLGCFLGNRFAKSRYGRVRVRRCVDQPRAFVSRPALAFPSALAAKVVAEHRAYPFQQLFTAVAELFGLKDKMAATGYELPDIAMVDDDSDDNSDDA
jgi:hypothetical protein